MTTQNKIQHAIYSLLKEEPFYAHFILNSKLMYDAYNIPTAGVTVASGVPLMVFNSEFVNKLTQPEIKGLLKHEVLHLVLDHLTSTKADGKNPYVANIAQDCTINQYIKELPEGGVTLDALNKQLKQNMLPFQTSDYYYEFLKAHVQKMLANGVTTTDDHGTPIPGTDLDVIAKGAVKRVTQSAVNKAAGNVPEFVIKALDQLNDSKLPWKALLRNAIMTQVSRKTMNTTKKINRRFALPVPGKKQKRTMTLGVCVDSSGSVSDAQFTEFLSEVKSIAKQITKTYLIHADCEVQAVEDLSKTKLEVKRKGNGGTAYQPAITKCKELGCTMIVYFGDFDCADKPQNPGVPFIWVGVGSQEAPGKFGKVIRL